MKTFVILLCILTFSLASFSVRLTRTGEALHVSSAQAASAHAAATGQDKADSGKSRFLTAFLAIFFGLHQFYLENYVGAGMYIILSFVGIGAVLSLADCILLVAMSDQQFHRDVLAGEIYWGIARFKRLLFGA